MFCSTYTRSLRVSRSLASNSVRLLSQLRGGGDASALPIASPAVSGSPEMNRLRKEMEFHGIHALLVPTDDPHLNEYVPAHFARREYLSGFTGSTGTALITHCAALLFTDGRYFQQAERELSADWTLMRSGLEGVPSPAEFLKSRLSVSDKVGIDPWVHSVESVQRLKDALKPMKIGVKLLRTNLVDSLWMRRSALPSRPLRVHPLQYAGVSTQEKLAVVREKMRREGADVLVLTALDEIMWLLNVRGQDIPCNPVAYCYAVVEQDVITLFIDSNKISPEAKKHFESNAVVARPYEEMLSFFKSLSKLGKKTWLDPKTVNMAIGRCVAKRNRVEKTSPLVLMKAVKNTAEIEGMALCHLRDAAAFVEFISALEERLQHGETVSEVEIDAELTRSRAQCKKFIEPSFDTIAGVNENGAIVHYRATAATCKTLTQNDMLLLDSGGQYLDGTTDVTRTFHFGTPSAVQKEMYTRVLRGHIAVDRSVFPVGTAGCLLDSFARQHLWRAGKNFNHGTGHGVGAALNVHEGPQRISPLLHDQGLLAGMVVSNEPGYYAPGEFGVRIENLLVAVDKPALGKSGGKGFLGFERLTQIPIQTKLIDISLFSSEDVQWLNEYHDEVREKVMPWLRSERAKRWLETATRHL